MKTVLSPGEFFVHSFLEYPLSAYYLHSTKGTLETISQSRPESLCLCLVGKVVAQPTGCW